MFFFSLLMFFTINLCSYNLGVYPLKICHFNVLFNYCHPFEMFTFNNEDKKGTGL